MHLSISIVICCLLERFLLVSIFCWGLFLLGSLFFGSVFFSCFLFGCFLAFAPLVAEALEAVFTLRQDNFHLKPEGATGANLGTDAIFGSMHIKDTLDNGKPKSATMIALSRRIGAAITLPNVGNIFRRNTAAVVANLYPHGIALDNLADNNQLIGADVG